MCYDNYVSELCWFYWCMWMWFFNWIMFNQGFIWFWLMRMWILLIVYMFIEMGGGGELLFWWGKKLIGMEFLLCCGFRVLEIFQLRWGFYLAAYMLYWMQIWLWDLKACFLQFSVWFTCFGSNLIICLGFRFWIVMLFLSGWWFLSVGHYFIVAWLSRFVCSVRRMTVIVSFMVLLLYNLAVTGSMVQSW